jgi:hypothetical protein
MSHDVRQKKRQQDHGRLSAVGKREFGCCWTKRLGVSKEQVARAVQQSGPAVLALEDFIKAVK